MFTDYQQLLKSISEAVLMLDINGYIQYANPAASTLTGYSSDELQNRPLAALYPILNDITKAEYELRQASKRGEYITEGWKTKKDQSKFWASMTLTPLYDDKRTLVGYSCLLRDATEQKNAELELRQSEEKYRLMVESVRDYAIFMLDAKGYIKTWNEGAARIKGYTAGEIIGKHFSTFYIAEDLESKKPEMELRVALATGKYEEEGWRVRKDGSLFWANVVITALFNEHNKLIGFSKVTRDLTERKEKDELLRQSEERFRSLVEQVTDYGIFMLDEKGRIISWNEGARRINGYTAQEIIGKYFSIFYPEEDIVKGKPAHELKVARSEGKYEEEGWRVRKDGSLFWANVVITAVYANDNILIGFSKVVRDLSERKESEKALRESYDRFRMLAEELKVTNFELSYANEELEQFTSIVSHDLQEPIRTIKSFLQLIDMKLDAKQDENLKTYIGKSVNAANRMRELIQNLLHYTQLSKGEIAKEYIDVNEVIEAALQNVKTAIDTTNAHVVVENNSCGVYGDRIQLIQLLQNLISNALKFTDAEQPQVRIACKNEHDTIKFSVADNGIGISKSNLPKVFDIFRRLHTEKDYPGTGIGLAICKKIVERHGGQIWPESELGKGTTFYFTIQKDKREA